MPDVPQDLLDRLSRVVFEARRLVRPAVVCGAPTASLEASLRMLDALVGKARTECARTCDGRLYRGDLEEGSEYLLLRDGKEPARFRYFGEDDDGRPAPGMPSPCFRAAFLPDGKPFRVWYADWGLEAYADGRWASCRVSKSVLPPKWLDGFLESMSEVVDLDSCDEDVPVV